MAATNSTNPFGWLPKPGESKKIPGGVIWCESWEVNQRQQGMMDGEIRFRFQVDAESYREAMRQPEALSEKPVLELESPNRDYPEGFSG